MIRVCKKGGEQALPYYKTLNEKFQCLSSFAEDNKQDLNKFL